MIRVPIQFCNQSIIFNRKLKPDPSDIYNTKKFDNQVEIKNCVVHLRTTYSGTNNDRQITSNGTVILFYGISVPFISLSKDDLGSIFEYEGKKYTLTNINEDRDPMSNEMYQYKLQII